ncbi:hypothetical protein [Posidoniimonas corsicana]|uniref:hypothetical protein n=1 Tax=Posidoniimonas corsicana TaxID=1938618 RepID=UPI0011B6069B|nr:hypothetical protein [Posidoniimonas corsicana]
MQKLTNEVLAICLFDVLQTFARCFLVVGVMQGLSYLEEPILLATPLSRSMVKNAEVLISMAVLVVSCLLGTWLLNGTDRMRELATMIEQANSQREAKVFWWSCFAFLWLLLVPLVQPGFLRGLSSLVATCSGITALGWLVNAAMTGER